MSEKKDNQGRPRVSGVIFKDKGNPAYSESDAERKQRLQDDTSAEDEKRKKEFAQVFNTEN